MRSDYQEMPILVVYRGKDELESHLILIMMMTMLPPLLSDPVKSLSIRDIMSLGVM